MRISLPHRALVAVATILTAAGATLLGASAASAAPSDPGGYVSTCDPSAVVGSGVPVYQAQDGMVVGRIVTANMTSVGADIVIDLTQGDAATCAGQLGLNVAAGSIALGSGVAPASFSNSQVHFTVTSAWLAAGSAGGATYGAVDLLIPRTDGSGNVRVGVSAEIVPAPAGSTPTPTATPTDASSPAATSTSAPTTDPASSGSTAPSSDAPATPVTSTAATPARAATPTATGFEVRTEMAAARSSQPAPQLQPLWVVVPGLLLLVGAAGYIIRRLSHVRQ